MTNLVPTTTSGLRAPRRVQTLPQVILAGHAIPTDRAGIERFLATHVGHETLLAEAQEKVAFLVDAKNIQAEFGLTEDEAALLAEEQANPTLHWFTDLAEENLDDDVRGFAVGEVS